MDSLISGVQNKDPVKRRRSKKPPKRPKLEEEEFIDEAAYALEVKLETPEEVRMIYLNLVFL